MSPGSGITAGPSQCSFISRSLFPPLYLYLSLSLPTVYTINTIPTIPMSLSYLCRYSFPYKPATLILVNILFPYLLPSLTLSTGLPHFVSLQPVRLRPAEYSIRQSGWVMCAGGSVGGVWEEKGHRRRPTAPAPVTNCLRATTGEPIDYVGVGLNLIQRVPSRPAAAAITPPSDWRAGRRRCVYRLMSPVIRPLSCSTANSAKEGFRKLCPVQGSE